MAWIESHTVLTRHRKVLLLSHDLKISIAQTIGHLHAFWHAVLEQQEDGDLSEWPDVMIEEAALWEGATPGEFVARLRARGWMDGNLVHDWLDYAGKFLISKYSSGNSRKLLEIWAKHGYKYGKGQRKFCKQQASSKRQVTDRQANIPNQPLNQPNQPLPNQPNLTNVVVRTRERKLEELEALSLSEELQSWAQREFRVRIPDDVLEEFKAYWREQKKLRTDWIATFKSRIRQLVSRGVLKPDARDALDAFLTSQGVSA